MRPRRDVGHLPTPSAGVKNDRDIPLLPHRALWHVRRQLGLSCSHAHHYLTSSAIRTHIITSHPQLFTCTPLPHILSCSHAHHYLTSSAIRMHIITSHPQLFVRTSLPHTLSYSHAHHYLTPCSSETHSRSNVFLSTFSSPNLSSPFIFSH